MQLRSLVGSKVKRKGKEAHFDIDEKDNSFVGKMPKPEFKPYSIDVNLNAGGKELQTVFDNID